MEGTTRRQRSLSTQTSFHFFLLSLYFISSLGGHLLLISSFLRVYSFQTAQSIVISRSFAPSDLVALRLSQRSTVVRRPYLAGRSCKNESVGCLNDGWETTDLESWANDCLRSTEADLAINIRKATSIGMYCESHGHQLFEYHIANTVGLIEETAPKRTNPPTTTPNLPSKPPCLSHSRNVVH